MSLNPLKAFKNGDVFFGAPKTLILNRYSPGCGLGDGFRNILSSPVYGSEIRTKTTWDVEIRIKNGINYQPQLVNAGLQPSTVGKIVMVYEVIPT